MICKGPRGEFPKRAEAAAGYDGAAVGELGSGIFGGAGERGGGGGGRGGGVDEVGSYGYVDGARDVEVEAGDCEGGREVREVGCCC